MIKIIKSVCAISFIIVIILTGCTNATGKGRVELIHDKTVYKPYEHWIFSDIEGLAADGIRLSSFALDYDPDLAKGFSLLDGIPRSDDFSVLKKSAAGKNIDELYDCMIYDENLELITRDGSIKDLPVGFDVIYLIFEVVWRDKNDQNGYQYIFKIKE